MTQIQSERLEAALLYILLGWPVLPCHTPDDHGICDCPRKDECSSPGKHPRTLNGLKDASTDEAAVRRWWDMWPHANIAIDLARSGLVDIAPDSIEWFAEFTARGLPPTARFASGGGEGHAHHLYARPDGCPIYRLTETGKYDILSAGYAIMPPSGGVRQPYAWIDGPPVLRPTEPVPPWAMGMLKVKQIKQGAQQRLVDQLPHADDGAPPIELRGDALERWYGRLVTTKPEGGLDRSYSLWYLAVGLLEAGCQPRFTEQLLAERDRILGWDKFAGRGDEDVRYHVIVQSALAGQGPGRIRIESRPPPTRGPLEWLTSAELDLVEDEDIDWVSLGWVGRGLLTELDGKVKQAGKTTLILALVRAILYREPFLGQPTTYCPILYLTEQSGPSFKRNIGRAGLLGRDDLHILLWSKAVGWKWDAVIAEACRKAANVGAGLLVIDTLSQFSGIRGDAENSSGGAMLVMEPLQAAAAGGLAVLVSRHDRKSGGDVGDSGRGSSAYAGAVDIVLHLQRLVGDNPGKERQRVLEGISRFEETPESLIIELLPGDPGEPYGYRSVGDTTEVREALLRIEILANLPTTEEDALARKELLEQISGRAIDVMRVLKQLIAEQVVSLVVRGRAHFYYQRIWED